MAVFSYTALKRDGSIANGDVTANDRADALRRLERNQLQPVSVKPKAEGAPAANAKGKEAAVPSAATKAPVEAKEKTADPAPQAKPASKAKGEVKMEPVKLKRAQIILFTEELSDLLGAGLQLEQALKIMESRDELSEVKDVTIMLRQKIRDGAGFAASLRESSPSFGELYCNMAAAGEISGALPKILRRQAEYMVNIQQLQSKVTTAMIYPLFLLVAGLSVAVLFVTNLIPQLTNLLKSMGKPMPLPAVIINRLGDFFADWWWLIIILIVGGIYLFNYMVELPQYKEKWHAKKLDLPFFGAMLRSRFYVQMLETMSNLVGNGLPLLRALELTRDATVNLHQKSLLTRVAAIVGEGGALSKALKKVGFFPPLLTDMVAVGEQTGDIEHSLERTAARYDKELQKVIDRVSALVQPAIIAAMAIIVGAMAYMMISVIMDSMSNMRR